MYTPLHLHTDQDSNLHSPDSIVKIPELIQKLKEFGIKSCAVTGHDSLSSTYQFWKQCRAEGIKPLLGWEGYLDLEDGTKHYHILLIAKTLKGYENLNKLTTKAWLENYYYRPRIKFDWLVEHKEDLIITDACLGGCIKKYISRGFEKEFEDNIEEAKKHYARAELLLSRFIDNFGEDFYLEIQAGMQPEQQMVNYKIAHLAEKYNVKLVATTDVHYLRPENKDVHEIFQSSRDDKEREIGNFYDYAYLMTREEIFEILSKQIGDELANKAIENTNEVRDKVEEYNIENDPILPEVHVPKLEFQGYFNQYFDQFEYIKKFYESDNLVDNYWLWMIEQGHLKNLEYNKQKYSDTKYLERIDRELEIKWNVSENLGERLSQYYVGMADDMNTIRDCNSLIGAGRGSICGFYTAYTANITQIDPLDYDIPEWRHLII